MAACREGQRPVLAHHAPHRQHLVATGVALTPDVGSKPPQRLVAVAKLPELSVVGAGREEALVTGVPGHGGTVGGGCARAERAQAEHQAGSVAQPEEAAKRAIEMSAAVVVPGLAGKRRIGCRLVCAGGFAFGPTGCLHEDRRALAPRDNLVDRVTEVARVEVLDAAVECLLVPVKLGAAERHLSASSQLLIEAHPCLSSLLVHDTSTLRRTQSH